MNCKEVMLNFIKNKIDNPLFGKTCLKNLVIILFSIVLDTTPFDVYAQECHTLQISAGTEDWRPIAYRNLKTNTLEGVSYDVIELIAKKLNIRIKIKHTPWKRMLSLLKNGDLDMAIAIYWNSERDKYLLYSVPYFENQAKIFVKKDKSFSLKKLEDLLPYHGVIPAGGSFGESFDSFAKENNLSLKGIYGEKHLKDKMAQLILMERYDYFISDYIDGVMYLKAAKQHEKIIALPYSINKVNVHFAFSRKSNLKKLLPKINILLNQFNNDGTIESIIHKFIN